MKSVSPMDGQSSSQKSDPIFPMEPQKPQLEKENGGKPPLEIPVAGLVVKGIHSQNGPRGPAQKGQEKKPLFRGPSSPFLGLPLIPAHEDKSQQVGGYTPVKPWRFHSVASFPLFIPHRRGNVLPFSSASAIITLQNHRKRAILMKLGIVAFSRFHVVAQISM